VTGTAGETPVRLAGVTKRYAGRTVLDDVSLDVLPGITGLIGPNGAGKSTLVRVILGLLRIDGGTVRVFGHDPFGRHSFGSESFGSDPGGGGRMVRQLVGVVPEDECCVPGLSGVETVAYAARLCGLPGRESLRRAHEVLDWCDCGQERYRAVETLSVGMRQKVTFAAALVHDPRLVILDEPTNGLDPLERRAMLGRLETLAREHGKTVLVSTHVLRDVEAVCDRVVVLAAGRVRAAGETAALTRSAAGLMQLTGTGPLADLAARLVLGGVRADVVGDQPGDAAQGPTAVRFPGVDAAGLRRVWEAAAEAGVMIESLGPATRPLEEVFLAAIAPAAEHESPGRGTGGADAPA